MEVDKQPNNDKKALEDMEKLTSTIKLTNFPRGFFAKQQLSYFKQFGVVKRVRLVYNRKSGRPSGVAFVQFDDPDVAEIACESMNNYLMFEKMMKCKQLRKMDLPKSITRENAPRMVAPPRRYAKSRKHSRVANEEKDKKQVMRAQKTLKSKLAKKNAELEKAGISYKFEFGPKTEASE
ncbi:hypothetical protein L596_023778 [Steinernema carpocapsae]|uniref:RRM domain-containing protein n=1 Tax=Steinernema carpocapsae TaxID=34508 RepID=A0A4U5MEQ6_STECR|nr:hypothetical protein L596_023778 [Steinernema carpocapsae]